MFEGRAYSTKYREMMTPVGGAMKKTPAWAPVFNDEMSDFWSGEVIWNAPLSDYTTFKVGGPAEAIILPRGCNELSLILQGLRKINIDWQILGRGSNVVIDDAGLPGVVILLGRNFSGIEIEQSDEDSVLVRVEAGCSLAKLVNWTVKNGYTGLEFLAGIPGSVGGAIVMNAGAWHREMKDVLSMVTVMDSSGCFCVTKTSEIDFSYRTWGEPEGKIALEGFIRLKRQSVEQVSNRYHEYHRQRKVLQPQNIASAGSFFKNPPGEKAAGKLIEDAGLKGFTVGGAMVSPKHANFIVNTGDATSDDIIEVMHHICETVQKEFGVTLEPEVKILK